MPKSYRVVSSGRWVELEATPDPNGDPELPGWAVGCLFWVFLAFIGLVLKGCGA